MQNTWIYGDFPFDPVMGFAHRVSRYANPAPSDFGVFWWDFGVWEAFQRTGNGCGIQIDEFSAQTEPYLSICKDFDDFVQPGIMQVRRIPRLWPGPGLGLKLWSLGLGLSAGPGPWARAWAQAAARCAPACLGHS